MNGHGSLRRYSIATVRWTLTRTKPDFHNSGRRPPAQNKRTPPRRIRRPRSRSWKEKLNVGKQQVATGGARIRGRIVEKPVEANVRLREEHVVINRRPVDREISDADLKSSGRARWEYRTRRGSGGR